MLNVVKACISQCFKKQSSIIVAFMIAYFVGIHNSKLVRKELKDRLGSLAGYGPGKYAAGHQYSKCLFYDFSRVFEVLKNCEHRDDLERMIRERQPIVKNGSARFYLVRRNLRRFEVYPHSLADIWFDFLQKLGLPAAANIEQPAFRILFYDWQEPPYAQPA